MLRDRRTEVDKCFRANENEKKRHYAQRVLRVENGSFTPLVFATNGGMGKECARFYKRLAEMIADKHKVPTTIVTKNIRTMISFSLMRSTIQCVRGSRNKKITPNITNIEGNNTLGSIKGD